MTFASVLIGGGLIAIYLSFAHVWLNREAYEAVICLSTSAQQNYCEDRLRRSAGQALPAGQVDLHLTKSRSLARVRLSFKIGDRKIFEMEDSRQLPLVSAINPLDKL